MGIAGGTVTGWCPNSPSLLPRPGSAIASHGGRARTPGAGKAGTENRPPGAGATPPGGAAARAIGSLQRSVRSEVALAAIVLVVAAVLSGLPPASFVEAAGQKTASPSVTVTGSDFGTTARVRLTVSPGTVGPNRFTVHVVGYDSGRPLPARGVRLEFSLPSNPTVASSLNLARGPGGTWTGQGTNLSIDGQWDIDVVIQQAGPRSTSRCGSAPGCRPSTSPSPGSQASRPSTRSSWKRPEPPDIPAAANTGPGPGSLHVLPGVGQGGAHHLRQRHSHRSRRRRPAAEAGPPRPPGTSWRT